MENLNCQLTKKLETGLIEGFDSIFSDMNENMEGLKRIKGFE